MINLKQSEAEKRRSAVQKNSFEQDYNSKTFFQFMTQRAKSARASSAARMRSTPSAGRVYTVTFTHLEFGTVLISPTDDDCNNISSFQNLFERPSFNAPIFAGAYWVSNRRTRWKLFRRNTCHLSRVHKRPTRKLKFPMICLCYRPAQTKILTESVTQKAAVWIANRFDKSWGLTFSKHVEYVLSCLAMQTSTYSQYNAL